MTSLPRDKTSLTLKTVSSVLPCRGRGEVYRYARPCLFIYSLRFCRAPVDKMTKNYQL